MVLGGGGGVSWDESVQDEMVVPFSDEGFKVFQQRQYEIPTCVSRPRSSVAREADVHVSHGQPGVASPSSTRAGTDSSGDKEMRCLLLPRPAGDGACRYACEGRVGLQAESST